MCFLELILEGFGHRRKEKDENESKPANEKKEQGATGGETEDVWCFLCVGQGCVMCWLYEVCWMAAVDWMLVGCLPRFSLLFVFLFL